MVDRPSKGNETEVVSFLVDQAFTLHASNEFVHQKNLFLEGNECLFLRMSPNKILG